ncbi:hypothetical protein [Streptomyces griseofuscus]|uniref:hypothetical protein n=1 Tax=Streptomyces griseofuscus TaxID=146922 RepID=UPI0036C046EA
MTVPPVLRPMLPVDFGAELPTLTAAPAEHATFELPEILSGSFRRLTHDLPHGHRLVVLTPPASRGRCAGCP